MSQTIKNEIETTKQADIKTDAATKTVPVEAYEKLYSQAIALEARYKKLFELYNNLLDLYLSK